MAKIPPDYVLQRYGYIKLLCKNLLSGKSIQLYVRFQENYLLLRRTTPHSPAGTDKNEKDPRFVGFQAAIRPRDLPKREAGVRIHYSHLVDKSLGVLRHYVSHLYVHSKMYLHHRVEPHAK